MGARKFPPGLIGRKGAARSFLRRPDCATVPLCAVALPEAGYQHVPMRWGLVPVLVEKTIR
jgi:hypothetical protein